MELSRRLMYSALLGNFYYARAYTASRQLLVISRSQQYFGRLELTASHDVVLYRFLHPIHRNAD